MRGDFVHDHEVEMILRCGRRHCSGE
jgi:hypothetical protein